LTTADNIYEEPNTILKVSMGHV